MKCFRCRREVKHPHMINGHVFGRCCAEFVGESPQIAIEWRKVEPKVLTDRERIAAVDWAKVPDAMVADILAMLETT